MNFTCLFLGHSWEQISSWLPIAQRRDFYDGIAIPMALGRCRRCGKTEPRAVGGRHSWMGYEEKTLEEAMEKWAPEIGKEAR